MHYAIGGEVYQLASIGGILALSEYLPWKHINNCDLSDKIF